MKALEQYQTYIKNLQQELKEFVNGMNTPAIKALSDKIEHMCNNLGDPLGVTQMLQSICNNTIKKWGGEDGKKKLGISNENEAYKENKQNKAIVVGHFRWDYGKAYLLDKNEINYIKHFYFAGESIAPSFDKESEYEVTAVNFIKKYNVDFKIKLLKKGKYFSDDKEERNIYGVTLKRKNESFEFTFGQSIAATQKNEVPSVYDILACLQKYEVGSFEDFCNEFGYDEDSKKVEKIYFSVLEEWKSVECLFNDVLEELQEIQ